MQSKSKAMQVMSQKECIALCDRTSAIECPICAAPACIECTMAYTMTLPDAKKPCCMECRGEFSKEFTDSKFPTSWITKGLRNKAQNVLLTNALRDQVNLEKVQDATASVLAGIAKQEAFWATEEEKLGVKISDRLKKSKEIIRNKEAEVEEVIAQEWRLRVQRTRLREEIEQARWNGDRKISTSKAAITRALIEAQFSTRSNDLDKAVVSAEMICMCPLPDCRGMVYSSANGTNGECRLCKTCVCERCHIAVVATEESPHACDKGDLASVKYIENNSTQCPGCRRPVQRSEGCSQMWCVCCKTAFDYSSGKRIENLRNFHNPEYVKYRQEQQDNNVVVAECGNDLLMPSDLTTIYRGGHDFRVKWDEKRRRTNEWNDMMNKFMPLGNPENVVNVASVRYMAKLMKEDEYGRLLYVQKQHEAFISEAQQILNAAQMATFAILDSMCIAAKDARTSKDIEELDAKFTAKLVDMVTYFNCAIVRHVKKNNRITGFQIDTETMLMHKMSLPKEKEKRKRNDAADASDAAASSVVVP